MAELRKEDLWVMADKLRNNMDSAEYKHVCLGLIFLKYISDSFERAYQEISQDEYADPEDRDEYLAKNVFWVPQEARWETIKNSAKDPTIGQVIDNAMYVIEKENSSLRGVLPKDFARASLDKRSLGELVDLLSELEIGNDKNKDTLGSVYEYFLGNYSALVLTNVSSDKRIYEVLHTTNPETTTVTSYIQENDPIPYNK